MVYSGAAGKVIEYGAVKGSSPRNLTRHRKNLSAKDNLSGIETIIWPSKAEKESES